MQARSLFGCGTAALGLPLSVAFAGSHLRGELTMHFGSRLGVRVWGFAFGYAANRSFFACPIVHLAVVHLRGFLSGHDFVDNSTVHIG